MPAVTVRNIPPETHRGLTQRARSRGVSTEAEIRAILQSAVFPEDRVKLGTALYKLGQGFAGIELNITRDKTPIESADFE